MNTKPEMSDVEAAVQRINDPITDEEKAWRLHLDRANREGWPVVTFDVKQMNKVVGALDKARTTDLRAELSRAPAEVHMACEDCDGSGVVGEEIYQGEFQPPEREQCSSCNGSGRWKVDAAPTPAEPAQQAELTDAQIASWIDCHGYTLEPEHIDTLRAFARFAANQKGD